MAGAHVSHASMYDGFFPFRPTSQPFAPSLRVSQKTTLVSPSQTHSVLFCWTEPCVSPLMWFLNDLRVEIVVFLDPHTCIALDRVLQPSLVPPSMSTSIHALPSMSTSIHASPSMLTLIHASPSMSTLIHVSPSMLHSMLSVMTCVALHVAAPLSQRPSFLPCALCGFQHVLWKKS